MYRSSMEPGSGSLGLATVIQVFHSDSGFGFKGEIMQQWHRPRDDRVQQWPRAKVQV